MRPGSLLLALAWSTAVSAAPDGAPPPARGFVQSAAQSDAFERTEAMLVLTGSRQPQVRAFAQRMIADHDPMARSLAGAAARAGLASPPTGMSEDQAHLLAALQGMTGHDLDLAYARQQVLAHRSALTVEQDYAARGDVPALRQAATAAVPIIAAHLAAAEQLSAALSGS